MVVVVKSGDRGRKLTSSREDGEVDPEQEAAICQVQGADDVTADGGLLVVFAPVDVGPAGAACAIEDVSGTDRFEDFHHGFTLFHADCRL